MWQGNEEEEEEEVKSSLTSLKAIKKEV